MEDKVFLFKTEDGKQYLTAKQTQFDAESEFQFVFGEDVDYSISEIEQEKVRDTENMEWF